MNQTNALVLLAVVSCVLSLLLTPVLREIFLALGVVDHPDHGRKTHQRAVPRVGGIAIAVSYAASVFIVQQWTHILGPHLILVMRLLPAACVIFVVGIIDDLWGLTAWQKLAGQLIAVAIVCSRGVLAVDVMRLHGLAWWTIPATVLWLLICTNGFNLVDGMDGLATGAGLFATLTIFVAALMQGNVSLAMATLPLAGCLLGFLCYNFNPATIFLGDSGSLLIGFLLGCYAIIWRQKSAALLGMTAPVMAFSLPLIDVGLAIVRRLLRRQPIFSGDREHIHHRLLARGMSSRKVALLLYGICCVGAAFSLILGAVRDRATSSALILLFCVIAIAGIRYLGYTEFSLAPKLLFRGEQKDELTCTPDGSSTRDSVVISILPMIPDEPA
jgi:UDP-GlcNAc:undecaprenyl-phosphate GlcNAc-1-phosphate transferase